jgi:ketosteroid isomerase-like protein
MALRSISNPPVGYNDSVHATTLTGSTHPVTAVERPRTEIAQQLFDAFNARDLEVTLTLLHPDVVFEPVSGAVLNDGEPYRGHEGMRRYFADVQAHWRELTVSPVHLRAAGNAVVALGHASGASAAGALRDAPTTWVFKFDNDLVVHIQIFSDERLAREALGL